jgi:hypothetical protein
MSINDSDAPVRIAEAGRERALQRMQDAFEHQFGTSSELEVDRSQLARDVADAVERAGSALWRISLAEAASEQFGLSVEEALAHPALSAAEQLIDAPAATFVLETEPGADIELATGEFAAVPEAETEAETAAADDEPAATPLGTAELLELDEMLSEPDPLRLGAIHTGGIEALAIGESDVELRLSRDGLDVLQRSSGAAIGRLEWAEIVTVEVKPVKRRMFRRASGYTLHVQTETGQASFSLPELSVPEADEHLRPTLQLWHGGARRDH